MIRARADEISFIIHDLIRISAALKEVNNKNLTAKQEEVLHNCQQRLYELREYILRKIKEDFDENELEKGN